MGLKGTMATMEAWLIIGYRLNPDTGEPERFIFKSQYDRHPDYYLPSKEWEQTDNVPEVLYSGRELE